MTKIKLQKTDNTKKKIILTNKAEYLKQELNNSYKLLRFRYSDENKEKYKQVKKDYHTELKVIRKNATSEIITNSKNISKTAWNLANKVRSQNGKLGGCEGNIHLDKDGEKLTDPASIVETFNKYFRGMGDNGSGVNMADALSNMQRVEASLKFEKTCKQELIKLTKKIDSKNSCGWDCISSKMLKTCLIPLLTPIEHLFNASLSTGKFPNLLKKGVIVPIFKKKGSKSQIENYRPITLTSSLGKLLEKIILIRLQKHFDDNLILHQFQHGFRRSFSTVTAMLEFSQEVVTNLDNKLKSAGVLLDMSKAFDCVSHFVLINKLQILGVREKSLDLIQSYLKNRLVTTQMTFNIDKWQIKYRSSEDSTVFGVPQGSLLGPFLFTVYINNIPNLNSAKLVAYADDMSLCVSAQSISELKLNCQNNAEILVKFLMSNNLVNNTQKTKFIIFKKKIDSGNTSQEQLTINGQQIVETNSDNFLGVEYDKTLTWQSHIMNVSTKLSSIVFLLRTLSPYVDTRTLKIVYYGLFHSKLSYGIEIWGSAADLYLHKLFVLQKSAIRVMFKLEYIQSCRNTFIEQDILTIYGLYIYKTLLVIRKNLAKYTRNKDIHNYNTRGSNKLHVNLIKSKVSFNFALNIGIKYFNKLPNEIQLLAENHESLFKQKLKKHLIDKCLYSLSEY